MLGLVLHETLVAHLREDRPSGVVDGPLEEEGVHAVDAHVPVVGDRRAHHFRSGPFASVVSAGHSRIVGGEHGVDGGIRALRSLHEPVDGHVGIDDHVGVNHGRDVVDETLLDPRANVVADPRVDLLGRVDPRSHLCPLARPAEGHLRHAADPVGQDRHTLGGVLVTEQERASAGRRCQIELDAVGGVVVRQLLEDEEVVLPQIVVEEARAALPGAHGRIGRSLRRYAEAGEEIHALVVRPVDEHRQRVEAPVDEALHVVPHAVGGRGLEPSRVVAEAQPHLGGVEQPVAARHAVDEGVDRRSGTLIDGYPRVLQRHWRLEHEQVVVPRVVEVDRALLFHGGFVLH